MLNEEIIFETVDWIEARIRDQLPVAAVAAKAGYSLHHFTRLFAGILGIGPKEYILRRKLSESAKELARRQKGVMETAFEFGFADADSFSRAFKREFGTSPSAVRRGARFIFFPPAERQAAQTRRAMRETSGLIRSVSVERASETLLAGWIVKPDRPDAIGKAWSLFQPRAESIASRRTPTRFRQFAWWNDWDEDSLEILIGVEMESLQGLSVDLAAKVSPECECLVFEHEGSTTAIPSSYSEIYGEILSSMNRKPGRSFNFETYQKPKSNERGDIRFRIWIPID